MCLFISDFFKSESGLLHALMRVATLLLFLFFFFFFFFFFLVFFLGVFKEVCISALLPILCVYKELLISFELKRSANRILYKKNLFFFIVEMQPSLFKRNEPKKRASPQVPPQGGNQPLAYARSYIKDDGH